MNFTNPLFVIPLTTGVVFVVAGIVMMKFPPKKINSLYGYRTLNSMRSQERWEFSQKYSARELIKLGAILVLSSIVGLVSDLEENIGLITGLGFTLFAVIFLILRTEHAIKTKFGKE